MTASIDIDQTDFKQGVAYLFELRKVQRARYLENMKNRTVAQREFVQATPNSPKPNKTNCKGDKEHG